MVMTRISNLVKAYVYEGLERLEDPSIMVKQYIRDVKDKMIQLEDSLQQKRKHETELIYKVRTAKELISRREQQAMMAVEKNDDELARKILVSKKEIGEQLVCSEQHLKENREEIKGKEEELERLKVKYEQLKERSLELIVRVQGIKTEHLEGHSIRTMHSVTDEFDEELNERKRSDEIENELQLLKTKK
ncbi:PspA/IM30 family protein [Halalkalibacter krulwichiae]|uniref:Phage shock protein PspA n=1 Tax=Halalkalibacter krulwichiae TaxID=199441 RepID=A0A1X9M6Y0_9BACI|nr:PspA/IM30 family protein [Halalkalibacter krulwichiae]ARK29179.1 phage shock protein PspA [Halalkalibacter krulwichiae]